MITLPKSLRQRLPLFVLTLPAAVWWWSGQDSRWLLLYVMLTGVVWTVFRVFGGGSNKRRKARFGSDPQEAQKRGLLPLDGLGKTDEDEGFKDRFPELMPKVTLIRNAIEHGADIRFRYQVDDDNELRQATPVFLREIRHYTAQEATLCINAYYHKRKKKVDFSLIRMSELEIVDPS